MTDPRMMCAPATTFDPYRNTEPFGDLTESQRAIFRGKPCVVFKASKGRNGRWEPATPDLFKSASVYRLARPAREKP